MRTVFFVFFFFIFVSLSKGQPLKGTTWRLKSIYNTETGNSKSIDNITNLLLLFESDSVYSGYGCNRYKGIYKSPDRKNMVMQKVETIVNPTCLGLVPLEKELLAFYLKATRYRIEDNNLFIFTSDDHRLMFSKQ